MKRGEQEKSFASAAMPRGIPNERDPQDETA